MTFVQENQCIHIDTYLDDELSDEARRLFEAHLDTCDACNEYSQNWEYISQSYADWTLQQTGYRPTVPNRSEVTSFVDQLRNRESLTQGSLTRGSSTKVVPLTPRNRKRTIVIWAAAALFIIGTLSYLIVTSTMAPPYVVSPNRPTIANTTNEQRFSFSSTQAHITLFSNGAKTTTQDTVSNGHLLTSRSEERILARIADDVIGLGHDSTLHIRQIHPTLSSFQLQKGYAAFKVAPRKKGTVFEVTAAKVTVTVIGTRFSVHLLPNDQVLVSVSAGTVRVTQNNDHLELPAGSRITISPDRSLKRTTATEADARNILNLLNDETIENSTSPSIQSPSDNSETKPKEKASTTPKLPKSTDNWRRMIIDGQIGTAESQIRAYLRTSPNDTDALMLLATCQQKSDHYSAAFETYQRIIHVAKPSIANRARYNAGEIAQNQLGKQVQAAAMFDAYLKHASTSSPNRGEAKMRLSKALLATGQRTRAQTLLQEIITEYGRAPVANRARALLDANP